MMELVARSELLLRLAREITTPPKDRPVLVGVDGVDGGGKTTLSAELRLVVESCDRTCLHVQLDDFQYPRAYRVRRGVRSPEGCYYDTFNYEAIHALLLDPLRGASDCRVRLHFFDQPSQRPYPEKWMTVPSNAVVIIDTSYLHRPELSGHWDMTMFVTVPYEMALLRGVGRDLAFQLQREPVPPEDVGKVETRIRDRWENAWIPAQKLYQRLVDPTSKADVLIDNTDPQFPRVEWRLCKG